MLMVLERAGPGVEFQFVSEDNQDAPAEPEKTKQPLHYFVTQKKILIFFLFELKT